MKQIIEILLWLWQLPQNIIGWIISLRLARIVKPSKYNSVNVYFSGIGNFSLGNYVFIKKSYGSSTMLLRHELGHSCQSRMLGFLYLLIVGLPSFIRYQKFIKQKSIIWSEYYRHFPEKWANKLGQKISIIQELQE